MPADGPGAPPKAARRRIVFVLAAAVLVVATVGGLWFARSAREVRRDPGLVYRDPATLALLVERAGEAERAGNRATAITAYRFVLAVGQGKQGGEAELAPYVAAARAGLRRLGVADTPPDPPR